jgi:hypothetical protein
MNIAAMVLLPNLIEATKFISLQIFRFSSALNLLFLCTKLLVFIDNYELKSPAFRQGFFNK